MELVSRQIAAVATPCIDVPLGAIRSIANWLPSFAIYTGMITAAGSRGKARRNETTERNREIKSLAEQLWAVNPSDKLSTVLHNVHFANVLVYTLRIPPILLISSSDHIAESYSGLEIKDTSFSRLVIRLLDISFGYHIEMQRQVRLLRKLLLESRWRHGRLWRMLIQYCIDPNKISRRTAAIFRDKLGQDWEVHRCGGVVKRESVSYPRSIEMLPDAAGFARFSTSICFAHPSGNWQHLCCARYFHRRIYAFRLYREDLVQRPTLIEATKAIDKSLIVFTLSENRICAASITCFSNKIYKVHDHCSSSKDQ